MGLIIAAGMKDGMYENVFTILVVGMAIDYAVHLAHFYIHAQGADTRYDKARDALFGVGISVIGGAITTVGAGIPLLFCVVMFFYTQVCGVHTQPLPMTMIEGATRSSFHVACSSSSHRIPPSSPLLLLLLYASIFPHSHSLRVAPHVTLLHPHVLHPPPPQGLFIIFTAICALFHAFFFLMPLLMIAGPEGNQGDLSTLFRALRRKGGAKVAQTKV